MFELLWLIPALPLMSFLTLALAGRRMGRRAATLTGVLPVAVATVIAGIISCTFIVNPPAGGAFTQKLWTWISVANFHPAVSLYLDPLSIVMTLVITFVSFLILLYSTEFMASDEGYSRFFAYMNLFVASMLVLVLADDLLLLYVGWEGVGLCSFLLIGFWYREEPNIRAARKAFIVTRIGDTAFAVGLLLLFVTCGTLNMQDILGIAGQTWTPGSTTAIIAAALLLGGALGKSAQLPLQTWLPDAMAGPTPVSALIHAATMVTAGVYLIARMNTVFFMAPPVQFAVAVIGASTLLYAGFSALTQWDIKRVLAYSTISQVGYMFLALGAGAWSAAVFHFMTHAFFKSLLFLAAGVVILAMRHEHDMFKMGGLRKKMPLVFWTFLAGAASLAALPLITGGFYSKDKILLDVFTSPRGGMWLWLAGVVGSLLTAMYSFRMVFLIFFGRCKQEPIRQPKTAMALPLVVLAVLAIVAGFIELPAMLGNSPIFSNFVGTIFSGSASVEYSSHSLSLETMLAAVASAVALGGVAVAYVLYLARPALLQSLLGRPAWATLNRFLFVGWGFDWLYDRLLVRPFVWVTRVNRNDFVDSIFDAVAFIAELLHRIIRTTQTGRLRWYAACIVAGAITTVAIVVFT